jgi:response regulator RpfG family c-di-GMP phosphodiesterase
MNIIILDNSATVRTKIEELLLQMDFDDLDINLFDNGEEALEYSRENDIDLIFSSIEAENMDGVTFVDTLLRDNPKHTRHLFIVTSQKNTENFEDIKDVGAKRFIQKPINETYFNHFVKQEIDIILNTQ